MFFFTLHCKMCLFILFDMNLCFASGQFLKTLSIYLLFCFGRLPTVFSY